MWNTFSIVVNVQMNIDWLDCSVDLDQGCSVWMKILPILQSLCLLLSFWAEKQTAPLCLWTHLVVEDGIASVPVLNGRCTSNWNRDAELGPQSVGDLSKGPGDARVQGTSSTHCCWLKRVTLRFHGIVFTLKRVSTDESVYRCPVRETQLQSPRVTNSLLLQPVGHGWRLRIPLPALCVWPGILLQSNNKSLFSSWNLMDNLNDVYNNLKWLFFKPNVSKS